jgi:hypothetical protein
VDDIDMLHFIQNSLGIGKVNSSGNSAVYRVSSQKELARIIEIFSKYPLNTTKHLNFLDFKKACFASNLHKFAKKISRNSSGSRGDKKWN